MIGIARYLHSAIRQRIPYLGMCLGGQLLANAFQAMVSRLPKEQIGFLQIHFTEAGKQDPLYQGLPGYQQAFQWHEDCFALPVGAVSLAHHEDGSNQAFRYLSHAYGLQYHVELTEEMLDIWMHDPSTKKEFIDAYGAGQYEKVEQQVAELFPTYAQHARILLENFFSISKLIESKGGNIMAYELIELAYSGDFATITMNCPQRRNALSLKHMLELTDAFRNVGESGVRGVMLAANGPVFSAGHDFADMVGQNVVAMRKLLHVCTTLMNTIQQIPQPVLACVQGFATAAGCQLVATCDLAVASTEAAFATPGGKGGWFCTTPMVAVSRNIGRKRALEMLLTGDPIDAQTAADWGLVNRVVPPALLVAEAQKLLAAATRGSFISKEIGKQAYYAQIDLAQFQAYAYAQEVMASASQIPDAQEGMQAFLEKRKPRFQ